MGLADGLVVGEVVGSGVWLVVGAGVEVGEVVGSTVVLELVLPGGVVVGSTAWL